MVEFITTEGVTIDLSPNQDVAITIENAFFSSDRIPVAWTTDIEMPASETNCRLFGYPDAMLLPAVRKQINVEMRINSIPVMTGKLRLLGPSSKSLKASFSGVAIEDSLTGSLINAPFNKWNFGKLVNADDKAHYDEIVVSANANTRDDFATPLMMRESQKSSPDVYTVNITPDSNESFATKYLNSPKGTFMVPVVKLKYILQTVFADCKIDDTYSNYINKIGIVAPYRKNGTVSDHKTGCLDKDDNGNYIINLAEAMPDVAVEEFVKSMLTTFCATIYVTKDGKQMISNNIIIQNQEFIDWSKKVADDIDQEFEDGQNYEYDFSDVTNTEIKSTIDDCTSITDCLVAEEGAIIRCADTGDIYTRINRPYIAGHDGKTYYENGLDILKQERMLIKKTVEKSLETYSATSDWSPVKTIPYRFRYSTDMIQWVEGIMIPMVDIPEAGGDRPNKIQFGIFENGPINLFSPPVQFTSNGCIGSYLGGFTSAIGTSINMGEFDGLYEKFHRIFKEWLAKDKTTTKVSVNLTASDIADLHIWKKIMLYNQLFFIKTLTIMLNTSKEDIHTEADLIRA